MLEKYRSNRHLSWSYNLERFIATFGNHMYERAFRVTYLLRESHPSTPTSPNPVP